MAAPSSHNAVPLDTLITIKVSVNDSLKKLKLPLRDLGATVLPDKLRQCLAIKPEQTVTFERFSDSAGGYITLDPNNPQVFKTLIRAAKAKLKLRLKATVTPVDPPQQEKESMAASQLPPKAVEPIIVRSPVYQNGNSSARDSTAFDRRSVGSGIFQFREARASQQTLVNTDEAPVPKPFTVDNKEFFNGLASHGNLAFRSKPELVATVINTGGHPWSVYCNECDKAMSNTHFHCSICDGGDYDLCEECVAGGKLCPGEGHWLIKRFISDGKVINSTTERVSPRPKKPAQSEDFEIKPLLPGSFSDETKALAHDSQVATRTCNNCVVVLPEHEFVTCTTCEDFDLCMTCHTSNKHGHHPGHGFEAATEETKLTMHAESLLAAGRNQRHNAICDGCEKNILGVRHKCLNCPDWDFCSECIKDSRHTHPRHRFAAIYTPIPDQMPAQVRHAGIYCDGPLCSSKGHQGYISGVRYKCAVCHDTDFCASCEALPGTHHNRTHPLIKFKTPVRNVSITTENADMRGNVRMMGDRRAAAAAAAQQSNASTETTPVQQANAAAQVRTVAEIVPTPEIKKEVAQAIPVIKSEEKESKPTEAPVPTSLLNAHFVQDSVSDGTVMSPGARFTQIWTLKNAGPYAWPAGCSVRYVGGDNMLNVDHVHPAPVTDIAEATESNVCGREVQVGEEVAFKVTLKAPLRTGKSISYWRLKAHDGTPFGHRLWCDITVAALEVPKPAEPAARIMQEAAHVATPQQVLQQQQMQMLRLREQQMSMMREQAQRMAQQAPKPTPFAPSTSPPAYSETSESLHQRLAAMRAEQQKRREQMMAQILARQNAEAPAVGSSVNDDDKARKEAAKQRVEHIKAKIIRTREERAKLREAAAAAQLGFQRQQALSAAEQKSAEETEKVRKMIEEVSQQAAEQEKAEAEAETQEMEGSQMVFPKLEKESPASSTYQSATSSTLGSGKAKAAYVENEDGEVERSAVPAVAPITPAVVAAPASEPSVSSPVDEEDGDFEDLTDDIEVLSASGDVSEDDGFLTDEEYDILDASDQETVASK